MYQQLCFLTRTGNSFCGQKNLTAILLKALRTVHAVRVAELGLADYERLRQGSNIRGYYHIVTGCGFVNP